MEWNGPSILVPSLSERTGPIHCLGHWRYLGGYFPKSSRETYSYQIPLYSWVNGYSYEMGIPNQPLRSITSNKWTHQQGVFCSWLNWNQPTNPSLSTWWWQNTASSIKYRRNMFPGISMMLLTRRYHRILWTIHQYITVYIYIYMYIYMYVYIYMCIYVSLIYST